MLCSQCGGAFEPGAQTSESTGPCPSCTQEQLAAPAPHELDLVTLAANRGLVDEGAARATLSGREPSLQLILEHRILNEAVARQLLDENARTHCGQCGRPYKMDGAQRTCAPCGVRLPSPSAGGAPPLPPDVAEAARDPRNEYGRYVRLRELGHGGMGAVHLAWDRTLARHVALKIPMLDKEGDAGRFRREALMAASISHPNIIAVHEVGEAQGEMFLAMQYVEGRAPDHEGLTVRRAAEIVRDAARAAHYAHEKGIIHRDLKPGNLLLDASGRVFVMDFGLAKRLGVKSSVSITGTVVGTPAYMAPEQAEGSKEIGPPADIYALGATLYDLTVGLPPFVGSVTQILRRIGSEEPIAPRRINHEIPRDVQVVIQKAMAKEPARRYATAGDLADDLDRFLRGEPIRARPASLAYKLVLRVRRNKLASAVVVAAAVLAIAAAVSWWRWPGRVDLTVEPEGPRVWLDGRALGEVRGLISRDLRAGDHSVVVDAGGYGREEKTFTIRRAESTRVQVEIRGLLDAEAVPAAAVISINDQRYGSRVPGLSLPVGVYTVRGELEGHFATERRVEIRKGETTRVRLFLDRGVMWEAENYSDVLQTRPLWDVDGDGYTEAVYVSSQELVCVSGADGREMWRTSVPLFAHLQVEELGGAAGRVLLARKSTPAGLCVRCIAPGRQPTERWHFDEPVENARTAQLPNDVQGVPNLVVLADITGDGVRELAGSSRTAHLYVIDGATGGRLREIRLPGYASDLRPAGERGDGVIFFMPRLEVGCASTTGGNVLWSTPARRAFDVADVDGDGTSEVLIGGDRGWRVVDARTGEPHGPGEVEVPEDATSADMMCSDLDGDGAAEVLLWRPGGALRALSARDGRTLWTFEGSVGWLACGRSLVVVHESERLSILEGATGRRLGAAEGEWRDPILFVDWDGDGAEEVLAASPSAGLVCFGPDGGQRWVLPSGGTSVRGVMADEDGDGLQEVLADTATSVLRVRRPRVIWAADEASAAIRASPRPVDVTGDGVPEVFAIGEWGRGEKNPMQVVCLEGRTALTLWQETAVRWASRLAGVADLNGDGSADVVLVIEAEDIVLAALDGRTGRRIWEVPLGDGIHAYGEPGVGDLTGDGIADVVFHTWQSKEIIGVDGRTGAVLWRVSTDNENMAGVALADLDGDGGLDVVAPCLDGNVYARRGRDGADLWKGPGGSEMRSPPAVADLTGDGCPEVLVGDVRGDLWILDGPTGRTLWRVQGAGAAEGRPVVVEIPGVPGPVILAPTGTGAGLVALSWARRETIWSHGEGTGVLATPAVADLDGDGRIEVIAGVSRGSQGSAIHVLDLRTGELLWKVDLEGPKIEADPAVADLDGDGVLDIVVGTYDGKLQVISGRGTRAARLRGEEW